MVKPRSVQDVNATPHFSFIYGAFRLSEWEIPYFASTISLEDAAQNLNLTADIPGAEEIDWRIEELYQRDINWPRVEQNIVHYLHDHNKAQFFNSLTIALLPFDTSTGRLRDSFEEVEGWTPPALAEEEDRFAQVEDVGPLRFGFWETWSSPDDPGFHRGEMRWNTKEIFGVAIDGQHRLAAIKSFMEQVGGTTQSDTRVPVIFLLFDERVGYRVPKQRPVVQILRELFIDLNKHAQTVNRARQILLDDRDPTAVSVRRMVGEKLNEEFHELSYVPPRIPLGLVDWHREQAKFDDGPYLTTVLGLDWMVSRVLKIKPIKDFTDYGALRTQLRQLEQQLAMKLPESHARLEEIEDIKLMPFSYPESELKKITEGFAEVWLSALCCILTKFSPYAEFIERRQQGKGLDLEFQHWYRLYDRKEKDSGEGQATIEYNKFVKRLAARQEKPVGEKTLKDRLAYLEEIKETNLAFKVVFQRALVSAFLEYQSITDRDIEELREESAGEEEFPDFAFEYGDDEFAVEEEEEDWGWPEDVGASPSDGELGQEEVEQGAGGLPRDQAILADRAKKRAEEFIGALNKVVTKWPSFLRVDGAFEGDQGEKWLFWSGTFRKPEGGIDFTQAASARATDLLFSVAAIDLYQSISGDKSADGFDEFWSWCMETEGAPRICKRVERAVTRFSKLTTSGSKGAAERILEARGGVYGEDAAFDEARTRLRKLWMVLSS